MNLRARSIAIALPLSLALACAGCGNQNSPADVNTPAPGQSSPIPPVGGAGMQAQGSPTQLKAQSRGMQDQTSPYGTASSATSPMQRGNGGPGSFDMLAGAKGYITQTDAARNPWFKQHFQQCDTNGDGRVMRPEFTACKQQYPAGTGSVPAGTSSTPAQAGTTR